MQQQIPPSIPIQSASKALQKKEIQITQQTKERVDACKLYIERKYTKLKQDDKEKKEDWEMLLKKMEAMQLSSKQKEIIKHDIIQKESELMRKKRQKLSAKNFDSIAIIGRGAFGEVRLCRSKDTMEIVAIKKMKKSEMLFKNQVGHVRAERDVLVNSNLPWIVNLICSFQDDRFLYLVMEYLPGGDLMSYLIKKDILSEDEAKFYIAECILAVDAVHKMNYIHRDLKPDNILLDAQGHIKLSDFGLCKRAEIKPMLDFGKKKENDDQSSKLTNLENIKKQSAPYKRNRKLAFSTVGTPDYIAPEVFLQGGYNETVDWWSLGIILFEMLVGHPPFQTEDPSTTCQNIIHWKKTFMIPLDAKLSSSAIDLIRRLIADSNERLGINGVEEIKAHPFFFGIDWKKIREKKAPYLPEIKSEIDTSNFDKFEEEEPWVMEGRQQKKGIKNTRNQDIDFFGYTFKKGVENQRSHLKQALENLEESMLNKGIKHMVELADFERRGSDSMLPEVKEDEKIITNSFQHQNITENHSYAKNPLQSNPIPKNVGIFQEQQKTLTKEKNIVQPQTILDKSNQKKAVLNPKIQALFARSNSPKDPSDQFQQYNNKPNTYAPLNKFNLPLKLGNKEEKEENYFMGNKGNPKGGYPNQTTKLQEQIKLLQQEQLLTKKEPPNFQNDTKNFGLPLNKPTMNDYLSDKLTNKDANETFTKINLINKNFGNSGSPKAIITTNSKPLLGDVGNKNTFFQEKKEGNIFKNQNPSNLNQDFINQKMN